MARTMSFQQQLEQALMHRQKNDRVQTLKWLRHLLDILSRSVLVLDQLLICRRIVAYALMAAAVCYGGYVLSIVFGHPPLDSFGQPILTDFVAHVTAGRIVLTGDLPHVYTVSHQRSVQHSIVGSGDPNHLNLYLSPPFVAMIYAPFAAMPYLLAAALWTLLTIALLVVALFFLWPLTPRIHHYGFWRVVLVLIASGPAFALLSYGQDSAISLILMVCGLRLLLARRDSAAGVVLGLGVFKPQWFILIPLLLLCQRRWSALLAWCATATTLALGSMYAVGVKGTLSYIALLTSDLYGVLQEQMAWKMIGVGALLHPLGIVGVGVVILVTLVLMFEFIRIACRPITDTEQWVKLFALLILVTLIVSPHGLFYDGVLLVIPALILLDQHNTSLVRVIITLAYLLLFLSPLHLAPWSVLPTLILFANATTRYLPSQASAFAFFSPHPESQTPYPPSSMVQ